MMVFFLELKGMLKMMRVMITSMMKRKRRRLLQSWMRIGVEMVMMGISRMMRRHGII